MIVLLGILSMAFPIGIWLGLEGYESAAFLCLFWGWVPIILVILVAVTSLTKKQ